MTTDYVTRLRIPVEGDDSIELFTRSGTLIAKGYRRIVIGDRGPYVELIEHNLVIDSLHEVDVPHFYYVELRSSPDNVKVYAQLRYVDYADYIPGMFYISPFELFMRDGVTLIDPIKKNKSE